MNRNRKASLNRSLFNLAKDIIHIILNNRILNQGIIANNMDFP